MSHNNNSARKNTSKTTKKPLKTFTGATRDNFNNSLSEKNRVFHNQKKQNQNISGIQYNIFTKKLKKKQSNNYKHNKSYEENALNNNILLQYKNESPLIPGNDGGCGNEILEILNLNGNKKNDNNNNNHSHNTKKVKKSNLNNSSLSQTKYKNVITETNIEYRNNILKDENKTDTKNTINSYRNHSASKKTKKNRNRSDEDIDHKEFIIGDNDKNKNKIKSKSKSNTKKLKTLNDNDENNKKKDKKKEKTNDKKSDKKNDKKIDKNNDKHYEKNNDKIVDNDNDKINDIINDNNNDLMDDDYLFESSFENNKTDFNLLYSDNYHKKVKKNMLTMEIQLLFEKIIDLQKSYHHQFHELCKTYDDQKNKLKTINEKRKFLRKKIIILLMQKEKKNLKENNNIYMDFRIKKNIANDSSKINKNEISIWNKMFPTKKITEKKTQKNALKQIFKTIAFDRYKSISHKLNTIEKTIVKRLYKKYHSHNKSHSNNKKKNNINNNNNNGKKNVNIKNNKKIEINLENLNRQKNISMSNGNPVNTPTKNIYYENMKKYNLKEKILNKDAKISVIKNKKRNFGKQNNNEENKKYGNEEKKENNKNLTDIKDNEKNSLVQLNLIKEKLEDNLKNMFNFSYGYYLNYERESDSSKSLYKFNNDYPNIKKD